MTDRPDTKHMSFQEFRQVIARELQIEVTLQAAAIAFEHGEEQAALLGGDVLARLLLPACGGTAGDTGVADAVVLLNGFLQ